MPVVTATTAAATKTPVESVNAAMSVAVIRVIQTLVAYSFLQVTAVSFCSMVERAERAQKREMEVA